MLPVRLPAALAGVRANLLLAPAAILVALVVLAAVSLTALRDSARLSHRETRRVVEVVRDGARRTAAGAATVDEARAAFERIDEAVADMSSGIAEIAAAAQEIAERAAVTEQAMSEVAAVAEQSSAASEGMSANSDQTSVSTTSIAASAQDLARTADALDQAMQRFCVSA